MHGTHMMAMVKKPRKQKMLNVGVQKVRGWGSASCALARRQALTAHRRPPAPQGVAAVLRNAELAEKRAAKRRAATEAEQPEVAAPKKRRQLPPRLSAPSESVAQPAAALRAAEAGGPSQAPAPAGCPAPSALQQGPDAGTQAVGREGSSNSKGEQHSGSLAKEHEVNFERQGLSTSHGVSGSMLQRDRDTVRSWRLVCSGADFFSA